MAPTLVEAGPHHQTWNNLPADDEAQSSPDLNRRGSGSRRVVAIESGMNYWDGQQWTPSDARFAISPEGNSFVADRVQHRTRLAANINEPGAVTVSMPDGTVLRSTPVAIGLFNAASGESVILAGIQDCVGTLVNENQVVYEDAFNVNGVSADVVYTIEKGSFTQDIVITGRLDPMDYGFSTNGARVQLYTELYDPPEPERMRQPIRVEQDKRLRDRMVSPDLVDELLGFGEFVLATGRAMAAGTPRASGESAAPVVKELVHREGRTFLLESVEFASVETELKSLPDRWVVGLDRNGARLETQYATIPAPSPQDHAQLMASIARDSSAAAKVYKPAGLAIDYLATLGGNISGTKVFQGDTTYFVSGPVYCSGTVYFEGGAIFKYPYSVGGGSPTTAFIRLASSVYCSASGYLPTIFTAGDDDSIGEIIWSDVWPEVTGDTTGKHYANPALWLHYNYFPSISNMKFSFCQEAIRSGNDFQTSGTTLSHVQLVNCIRGIVLTGSGSGSGSGTAVPLTVNNALMANVRYPFTFNTIAYANVLRHCTIDRSARLVTASASTTLNFANSVFAQVTNLTSGPASLSGTYNGFSPSTRPLFGSTSTRWTADYPPFQTSGVGARYLKPDSVFRSKGSTGVGSSLLNSFKTKSTQPPIDFPQLMRMSGELALFPQIPRYVSGAPDLGYWYDVLDYTVAAMRVDGGSIVVMPGTAIGVRQEWVPNHADYSYIGFELWEGASFVSHGFPERPVTFVPTRLVQEESDLEFGAYRVFWLSQNPPIIVTDAYTFAPSFLPNPYGAPPPTLALRFSNLYGHQWTFHLFSGVSKALAWEGSLNSCMKWAMRDCNLYGGSIVVGPPTLWVDRNAVWGNGNVEWVNNTFDRVAIVLQPTYLSDGYAMNVDMAFAAYNNLFRNQGFVLDPIPASAGNWLFKDNLFDKAGFTFAGSGSLDHGHNAYWQRVGNELESGQSAILQPQPVSGDVILTAAPPYQSGPFGNHYVATSCPLYNSLKRGSRTPAAAGLFHYTTRLDQTKDGSQSGNVIIGRHYVAAVNWATAQRKDTDSDGIPDSVEDSNGNGQWEQDLETKIDAAYTTAGIPDSLNVVYDDVDLDGDGLPGIIEKVLGKQPLVSDNPLTPSQVIPEGQGIYSVPLSFSYALIEDIGVLNLNVNGAAATLDAADPGTGGLAVLRWNSLFDPPGQHYLQPQLFAGGPNSGSDAAHGVGAMLPFLSANVLRFYETGSMFNGNIAYIDAVLPRLNATYAISLYDASTTPPTYIDTIGPHSTYDGRIQEDWNVTYANGTPFTGSTVEATFDVTLDGSGVLPAQQGTGTKLLTRQENAQNEPGLGKFNVAYMHISNHSWMDPEFAKDGRIWNGMLGVVDALMKPNMSYDVYESSFNRYTHPTWQAYPGYLTSRSIVTGQLLPTFANTHSFYCSAHGNGAWLASESEDVYIKKSEVASQLRNRRKGCWGVGGYERQHPYRFVFLDACSSAKTKHWARAFGIVPKAIELDAGGNLIDPQAFLGWFKPVANPFGGPLKDVPVVERIHWKEYAQEYTATLLQFYFNWMTGETLKECIRQASDPALAHPFPADVEFNDVVLIGEKFVDNIVGDPYVVGNSGLTVRSHVAADDDEYVPPYQKKP